MKESGLKRLRILFAWCLLALNLAFILSVPVHADMGPKPSVSVEVRNAPNQKYCIGLLTTEERRANEEEKSKEAEADLKELLMQRIMEYDVDGWTIAYSRHGMRYAYYSEDVISGSTLEQVPEGTESKCVYSFTYYAPSNFKVILVTEDGTVHVSNEVTTTRFSAKCVYDLTTGELSEDEEGYRREDGVFLAQSLVCVAGTLVVEGLILFVFGLYQVRNLPIFLIANLLTQAFMHIDNWFYRMRNGYGGMAGLFRLVQKEFYIVIVECILYAIFMKQKDGKKWICVVYALVANILSALVGILIL